MTRREFLIGAGAGVVTLGAWSVVGPTAVLRPDIKYPQSGWLWANRKEPLIGWDYGPWSLIKGIACEDPLFNDPENNTGIMRHLFNRFPSGRTLNDPAPLMGDFFQMVVHTCEENLPKDHGFDTALEAAYIALGAVLSPRWTNEEVRKIFGVSASGPDESPWLKSHLFEIPRVFPINPGIWHGENEDDYLEQGPGIDRGPHYAFHGSLSFIQARSIQANLHKAEEMPNLARLIGFRDFLP